MTALQCPARVFVARTSGAGTEAGLEVGTQAGAEAAALAAALRAERIARVWCGPLPAVVEAAEAVAALLGVGVVVREDLRGLRVEGRLPAVLEEIADEHRGEAVLVVGDDRTLPEAGPETGPETGAWTGLLELEVDADGWRVVRRGTAAD